MSKRVIDLSDELIHHAVALASGREGETPPKADKIGYLQEVRALSSDASRRLDDALITQLERLDAGLAEAAQNLEMIQGLLNQYGAAPLHPAIYLGKETTWHGSMARVACGSAQRAVAFSEHVDAGALKRGDSVFLSGNETVLVARASEVGTLSGELAAFERYLPDGRIVLRAHGDETVVVEGAAGLDDMVLRAGDQVRWDRIARLCLEKLADADVDPYRMEEIEDLALDQIGGQRANLQRILEPLTASLLYPQLAGRYRLPGAGTLLLHGPPGCGKTYMARIAVSEVSRRSGTRARFSVVNASAWESPWVGQTQANITRCFESLRRAAEEGPSVLFIDEIDAVGRIRGGQASHHSDKFLGTLLTELSGFQGMKNVTVIAACNRRDLLDSALLSRFAVEIPISRPNLQMAREIFAIHLETDVPYAAPVGAEPQARQSLVERAVSLLYAPNAGNDVCVLTLRDGKKRTVAARELASGRLIQQLCITAKRRALLREIEQDVAGLQMQDVVGLRIDDLEYAVVEVIERLTTTLTAYNAHNYLDDLKEDEMVVSVEPVVRRVAQPARYVRVA